MGTLASCSFSFSYVDVRVRLHSVPLHNERIQVFKTKSSKKKKGGSFSCCLQSKGGVSYRRVSFRTFDSFICFCSANHNSNNSEKNEDNAPNDSSVTTTSSSPDETEEKSSSSSSSSNANEFTSDKTPTSASSPVHFSPFHFFLVLLTLIGI